MTCLCALHVHQCNVIYLLIMETLNTGNENFDNIRSDLQQNLNNITGWCCRNQMALNPNKTKCMWMATRQKHQKQQLPFNLQFKLRDHAKRARFNTSPTCRNCKRANKVANAYEQHLQILAIVSSFKTKPNCQPSSKISLLLCTHYVTQKLCFKCKGWMCLCAHEATVLSPQSCRNVVNTYSNMDSKQKCYVLKLIPMDKELLLST